jgi:hypothetical protein
VAGCFELLMRDSAVVRRGVRWGGLPTPCHNASAKLLSKYCLRGQRVTIRGPLTVSTLAFNFGETLPPYLLAHADEFPSSWFAHLTGDRTPAARIRKRTDRRRANSERGPTLGAVTVGL